MDTKSVVAIVEKRRAELDLLDEVPGMTDDSRRFAVARETQAEKVRDKLDAFAKFNPDAPREQVVAVIEKVRADLQAKLAETPAPPPHYSAYAKLQTEIDQCNELISLVPPEVAPETKSHAKSK